MSTNTLPTLSNTKTKIKVKTNKTKTKTKNTPTTRSYSCQLSFIPKGYTRTQYNDEVLSNPPWWMCFVCCLIKHQKLQDLDDLAPEVHEVPHHVFVDANKGILSAATVKWAESIKKPNVIVTITRIYNNKTTNLTISYDDEKGIFLTKN